LEDALNHVEEEHHVIISCTSLIGKDQKVEK